MDTKKKEELFKSLLILLAMVWSFATYAVTVLYLWMTFHHAGERPPSAMILGAVIFLVMTSLGALAMGRGWRGAPAGIALAAATPYFIFSPWAGWILMVPGVLTFTFYYLIGRYNAGRLCCRPVQT